MDELLLQVIRDRRRSGRSTFRRKDGKPVEVEYRATETSVAGVPFFVSACWPVDESLAAAHRDVERERALVRGADELAEERRWPRRPRLELGVELARDEPRVVGSSTISTRRPPWNVPETTRPASTSCSRYWLLTS